MSRLTWRNPKDGKIYLYGENADVVGKLAEYEDAEEQGVLLRLPCKVGDTVYIIQPNGQIKANEADMMFLGVMWDEYGKEWFTTKEDAESALAELRSTEATHMSR